MGKTNGTPSAIKSLSITMLEATANLAENLAQAEPFLRFKAASDRLNADREAQGLLKELSEVQQRLRDQQYSGDIAREDIHRLRALQQTLGTNETLQDFLLTQELAAAFLREVNQEISQLLGIDFASLTRRSGCC